MEQAEVILTEIDEILKTFSEEKLKRLLNFLRKEKVDKSDDKKLLENLKQIMDEDDELLKRVK